MADTATLDTSIRYLKGVGLERSKALARLGLFTLGDLFYFFPRRYENRFPLKRIAELECCDKECVMGIVSSRGLIRTKTGQVIFRVVVADGKKTLYVSWFGMPYLAKVFLPKTKVLLYGAAERKGKRIEMVHPDYEIVQGFSRSATVHSGRITPIYPLTEDLSQKGLRQIVYGLIHEHLGLVVDPLPAHLRARLKLPGLADAFSAIHFPGSDAQRAAAYRRLVFDEFFELMLAVQAKRRHLELKQTALAHPTGDEKVAEFIDSLGFELTAGQKSAVGDIIADMKKSSPMHRLVQGDVGSGKTAVAAAALCFTAANGYQGALMAPTEILAQQHFYTLTRTLEPLGFRVDYLAGGVTGPERASVLERIADGRTDIVIGTHALVGPDVAFKKLGLAVVDEQHKFGVFQRSVLKEARGAGAAHFLLMTATPIPRSLALTLYGDLDLSTIRESPKGRMPIRTLWIDEPGRDAVYRFVESELERGRQAFVVAPRISSERDLTIKTALGAYKQLEGHFEHRRVGLLHGRMRAAEKTRVMQDFKDKKIDILVSTVVIEVGIDVPNATVLVIENAELFGLAGLHQLRGRIGRGAHESYCFLFSESRDEDAVRRLEAFAETESGFDIAESDLEIRGTGDVAGLSQHGRMDLRIGDLLADIRILEAARKEAIALVTADPLFERPEHASLRKAVERRFGLGAAKAAVAG